MGRNAPAATRTAQVALPVFEMTRAPTATVCIQDPMYEMNPAIHSSVKLRCRNGRNEEGPRPVGAVAWSL
jgi:hypothetical protein